MRLKAITLSVLAGFGYSAWVSADVDLAALNCLNCHSGDADIPVIQGRPEPVLLDALRAFKNGDKPSTVMTKIAKAYSDDELQALARYFSQR